MKRVLVIDDEPDVLDSLMLALGETYDVVPAIDGAAALSVLEREAVDAVILDLMMPAMDGPSLMRELRRRGVAAPVLVVSASTQVARTATELGATDYLPKPFRLSELEDKLARILDHSPSGATPPTCADLAEG